VTLSCSVADGVYAVYLLFCGQGSLDMKMLSFRNI